MRVLFDKTLYIYIYNVIEKPVKSAKFIHVKSCNKGYLVETYPT